MTAQVTTSTPIRVALRGHDSTARRARTSRPAGSSPTSTPDDVAPAPESRRPSASSDPTERANGWLVAGSVLVAIALFSALALSSFATLG
ncbi:hypothetical protein H9623_01925 [Oerskovia sp. Sa1BUA8]|uniref:Uncharacterized protein n=1 Tax=Oerskovia douganii TaxID=2762210 RepID=A0A9D5U9Y6_9CELL|nr:hypothetical protein [Oerskovia douganii]MBE7699066.1 hypothetical protein [Oerskovia douganii]